jgi:phosphoserine / homoserine phosphotransferase
MMHVCCLDLEGILLPEIWVAVARRFMVRDLLVTTRDIPNYDTLMKYRLKILKREGIKLCDIQSVIKHLQPLPGAQSFVNQLRKKFPIIILSDTYYEFVGPLMEKLGNPTLFCNWLRVDHVGYISHYVLRQKDGKRKAVKALKGLGFRVKAVGDSFNDLTMLHEAHEGILFHPPDSIKRKYKRFPVASNYKVLLRLFCK